MKSLPRPLAPWHVETPRIISPIAGGFAQMFFVDGDVLHVGVKRDPTNFSTPAMRVTFDFFSRPRRVQMRESY